MKEEYICPNCKKMNDNAKKYNVKNSKGKPVGNNPMSLPPPSAPVNKIGTHNNIPNNNTHSAPVTPQNPIPIIPDNDGKVPSLVRRSSTLLEEMDDSTNTDTNQNISASLEVDSQEVITEGTDENFEQDTNNMNQFEQEIEQEKEVINYSENNNEINNAISNATDNEEESKNEVNEESLEPPSVEDQQVQNNEQTDDKDLNKQN
ncbi:hypothetical protein PIROE2DRAFT_68581 [Piromyces sp. E2]|nr:hypothetical protein PIROE2DRAFT_68581 [Piromyces sp. E2]|eukprot:OUM69168.1 hypothetical protein PIROE2DRAFT_68581 [Piromyces sp. E2]